MNNFRNNLNMGMRLGLFLPCKLSDFKFSIDQLVLLVMLDLLLEFVIDYAQVISRPDFNLYALPTHSLSLVCFFLAAYLTGKLLRRDFACLQIGVVVYSFGPLAIALEQVLIQPYFQTANANVWQSYLFSFYLLAVLYRALYLVCGNLKWLAATALVLMTLALSLPQTFFGEYKHFWFAGETSQDKVDPYAEYRLLDAETLMYRQPEILGKALAQLRPQREKITDLFFVGFASYATEDVFSKEVGYAKQLLEERFDTKGHGINLINHLHTLDHTPLATATNLAFTLNRIGKLMNAEEDVLLLYLTSHGSKEHRLSVDFWPLALNDITPEKLNAMLDKAGIKWRVIIVSACYSGGFVKALQGPATLVATAAAADKTSFGCGVESEFTYFGEALFKEQLTRQSSFITALQQADISIRQREMREELEASLPQLSIGGTIEAKLMQMDKDMHRYQCSIAKMKMPDC